MIEPGRQYLRNPSVTAITTADRVILLKPGSPAQHLTDTNSTALMQLWEKLASPLDSWALAEILSDAPESLRNVVDSMISDASILRGAPGEFSEEESGADSVGELPCEHLVMGVTGAVQSVFTPQLVRRLSQEFARKIDVILTRSAQEFLLPRAVSVFGARVWCDPFEVREGMPTPHAQLAGSASMVLVIPAGANAVFRLANGAASDLMALVVLATEAPVVVVPSMHPVMWRKAAVRRNVEILRGDGVFVIEPGVTPQLGAAGLGAGSANLIGALTEILSLSRPRNPQP